ncbi:EutP/PduV family microcompartment system protein [Paenibacillus melissococcoides]|uniref:EutP/PduV family microcompartment system protein n=1 Tax=Paenibacillus melissococcoides TaxID=2912268 RepID=A0ABN8U9F7_9BACL|nr:MULTISPECIES: EutP/PduV family microcompartment system protein [Paenibacillus]MEB9896804.1 EutP/PduV family microcompartment system protein [Bacillus cereus]CAH8247807.1 EutP/PduV family microcompartment system protein [Paenibacillus melissococcoides]CAH8719483.1 EutP/PduV family microcompartment system protein [Paenibacillus melissococcoides]CAH8720491.1 EutP/PduV family microcompartment system protein [Paenibacillus melissococcoides]GIO81257.1 ethanolamine utilization protein EutP [Paenib
MKTIIFAGSTGSGKTTLCQWLHGQEIAYKKTQAVETFDQAIDTPGECIENRYLYKMLLVSSVDADVIGLVQDCTKEESYFPPAFATMFAKPVIGIVTKTELARTEEDIAQARAFLHAAGAERIFEVSTVENVGVDALRAYLEE